MPTSCSWSSSGSSGGLPHRDRAGGSRGTRGRRAGGLRSTTGATTFTLISKDCEDLVVDGASMGTGHFNTIWIRITGPDQLRTIEGVPDESVSPTDLLHPVAFQTDNAGSPRRPRLRCPGDVTSSMTMDPAAPGTMTGTVEDDDPDRPLSYRYTMDNTNEIPPGTQGVVRVLQGTDDGGDDLTYDIEYPVEGGSSPIRPPSGSIPGRRRGPGRHRLLRRRPKPEPGCDVAISRNAG